MDRKKIRGGGEIDMVTEIPSPPSYVLHCYTAYTQYTVREVLHRNNRIKETVGFIFYCAAISCYDYCQIPLATDKNEQ